mgnify:CR=1 FL=1
MITAKLGDITKMPAQAIVNSANPSLLAGGGVCGAIHQAAGPQLELACRAIDSIKPGKALITNAFELPAVYVIHAVGPRYMDGNRGEAAVLAQTYRSICQLVEEHGITSISIPSIDNDFAAGEARIRCRPTNMERPGRVDVEPHTRTPQVPKRRLD